MRKKILIGILSVILFVTLSQTVLAVSWLPLVPCGMTNDNPDTPQDERKPCNRCDLFRLAKNIIDFVLIVIMPATAFLFFIYAGFLILSSAGNPGRVSQGRTIFFNTAIGVAIISASWLITNTIIRSVAADNVAPEWWKFECRVTTAGPSAPVPPVPAPILCSQPAQLAASNNEPYPRKNAPELDSLISCIQSKLPGQNLGSQYTFDNSFELCNYTRGQKTCTSSCSHAVNSCHYGGRTGGQGALAVDFGNELIGANIIQAAVACGTPSGKARCENAAGANVGCAPGSGATHVHVSAASCDAN
ncbi:MAG: hypothetical protein A3I26_02745 [Candidatus Yanofskybacteria bacterium RIFCSPLOWO2_02_FULL_43_10]|uniref:Uncharacterized protein n=1 Tax=Candidatus Yanofskybacteria bacterium RIFCSPLOWO2_12_FULL_43_11b TaxID=1802710 RepID=A0A1F8H9N2_9BACT|nr:MAG: hypothetical protein A2742_01670 [Candidatus Yanofskybacteria bacterium RIFCSPHIGHO2_01_FULL_43_32]OGN11703.1 MAG: hypothetical protein A3C69_04030 [Candidatus Yanofskybacteria bacterium RIFCSPHIGHO2_02_FULL_43_12]OGN18097.1 MAG: hypothetical protein A3E34_02410 [Candidatus Yanofskybacteria bacterium RIFCSPHIGHO2_12_FULL_43_11]OGN25315.1 MAG: hypothetical protein A2923_01460 [Candidatus Yanofskybacteria bacterium RIFCSPLOWO2_01_FULL_43_46]OGN28600.1 MAG: hypothetical protein A3I26_02745